MVVHNLSARCSDRGYLANILRHRVDKPCLEIGGHGNTAAASIARHPSRTYTNKSVCCGSRSAQFRGFRCDRERPVHKEDMQKEVQWCSQSRIVVFAVIVVVVVVVLCIN